MGSTVVGTQKRRIAAKHQAAPLARCLDIHWTAWVEVGRRKVGSGEWFHWFGRGGYSKRRQEPQVQ